LKNYELNPDRESYGWASNNSIFAEIGMDYNSIVDRIADNAEPGLFWLENSKKYGRMIETEANWKDSRVEGINPCGEITLESHELCVSGNTRILTKSGYPKIKDVVGKDVEIWNGKEWSCVKPFRTGTNKKLLRVVFSDGSHLECTPEHRFSIETSKHGGIATHKQIEAKNLLIGHKLELLETNGEIEGFHDDNAFEWGFFAGDGYLDGGSINAVVCGDKAKLESLGMKGTFGIPQEKEGYSDPVNRVYLKKILKDFDMAKNLNDKDSGIPEYFFNMDKSSTLEFIAGWIESDGTIQKNEGSSHYRIYGSYQKMIDLQLILRRIGINYVSVSVASPKGFETNFGARSRDLFYVTIPSSECNKISENLRIKKIDDKLIASGFINNPAYKQSKQVRKTKRQRIVSIETIEGLFDTFCFTETKLHKGVFGNVLTHQCNLVESIPYNHDTLEDYKITLKYAYLYAKTITLLGTHWQDTNRVMLRNRRLGVSMTGLVMALQKHGYNEMKQWMEEGYETSKYYDKVYSDWFAIPESIKLTAAKPSGTVSLLAGVTPGIHFPESNCYIRRVRISKLSPFVKVLKNAGYKVEPAVGQEDSTMVVEFPIFIGNNIRTIEDVSMWEQLALAAFVQKHWADNSVSVTVTFKQEEAKDIAHALNYYQYQLKAVSFLPRLETGAYAQMPYEKIDKATFDKMTARLKPLDFSKASGVESIGEKYCTNDTCAIEESDSSNPVAPILSL
jgi:hypothetical protein